MKIEFLMIKNKIKLGKLYQPTRNINSYLFDEFHHYQISKTKERNSSIRFYDRSTVTAPNFQWISVSSSVVMMPFKLHDQSEYPQISTDMISFLLGKQKHICPLDIFVGSTEEKQDCWYWNIKTNE